MRTSLYSLIVLTSGVTALGGVPDFEARVVDPEIGAVCYAVTGADVNGDGKLDIVAVSENRVLWYEAPHWTPHVILENQVELDHVCIAAHDIDGDGQVDFALGAGWIKANTGSIQWITRGKDPAARWAVHLIHKETSTHRMSFADVLSTGRKALVVSPLNRSLNPAGVRLMAFEIPAQPCTERWAMTVLDESLNRMHNHTHADWTGDGRLDTITASEEGVYLIHGKDDGFQKRQIGTGATGNKPELRGAGEIRVGKFQNGNTFLTTIEPMHGTSVVVYTRPDDPNQPLRRNVIDDTLMQGHAVYAADFDGDGTDEILAGHRQAGAGPVKGPGLYLYSWTPASQSWVKTVLDDGGIAVEDATVADFNGDGQLDIVAGGRATHNVKLYLNRGTAR